jgi:hypothetical protein
VTEDLFCAECEQLLNREYEQPNVSFWSYLDGRGSCPPGVSERRVRTPDGNGARLLAGVDYKSLKLLLLSILWRSGAAARSEFGQVRLGPHQETLRSMVLEGKPGDERAYPILLAQYRDQSFRAIVLPWHQRVRGHKAYHLVLGSVQLSFLVSSHVEYDPMSTLSVREDGHLLVRIIDPEESEVVRAVREIDRQARETSAVTRAIERGRDR